MSNLNATIDAINEVTAVTQHAAAECAKTLPDDQAAVDQGATFLEQHLNALISLRDRGPTDSSQLSVVQHAAVLFALAYLQMSFKQSVIANAMAVQPDLDIVKQAMKDAAGGEGSGQS